MSIKIDSTPQGSKAQASGGRASTNTLLSRMDKRPLADRMSEGDAPNKYGFTCVWVSSPTHAFLRGADEKPGPVRNPRGKGKQGGGKGGRVKSAPKTAEDLDKELEAFMGEGDAKGEKDKEDVAMA